jgi:hypothetical protein
VVERAELEADHLSPSNAEVKNKWICTSNPSIRCHGPRREKCPFFFEKTDMFKEIVR